MKERDRKSLKSSKSRTALNRQDAAKVAGIPAESRQDKRERPIIFSPEMVAAIFNGRKNQTRRVVKQQPPAGYERHCWFDAPVYGWTKELPPAELWHKAKCPYGKPGDLLWVREAWCYWGAVADPITASTIAYRADADMAGVRWRSPYHMFRWASRITLEVTDVRVQRVQEISEEDVRAEGVELAWGDRQTLGSDQARAIELLYAQLWDRINGKTHPWRGNPWVWAISFRRVA